MAQKSKLKILYIITKSNFGGAQRYVYDLATNLPKDKFEPLVAFGGNGQLKNKLEEAGIPTISILGLQRDIGVFKELQVFTSLLKIIRDVKPDLVHLNSSKVGILGALAVRVYNLSLKLSTFNFSLSTCKVIFTAHGWAFKEKRRAMVKKIISYISWLTVFLSHNTIVVSKDDRDRVKNFLFVQKKIKLVQNGIGPQTFLDRIEARKILAEKAGWPANDRRLWVGSIAELHKNKGIEYALRAFSELTKKHAAENKENCEEAAYLVIGGGEERQRLQSVIQEEHVAGKAALVGEYIGAAKLLRAFDIFLLPSLKEGLPYALLEAGAAGLPAIATNVGGVSEIIDDMKSGIVIREKRTREIAEALDFLISHEEKRKEFGDSLAKTVAEKFTLERMVRETIGVYNKK